MASRNEIIENTKPRYKKAKKKERSLILDELTKATGLSRDHLALRLRQARKPKLSRQAQASLPKPLKTRGRKAKYGHPHQDALIRLWTLLGFIASKRLKEALPVLLEALAI